MIVESKAMKLADLMETNLAERSVIGKVAKLAAMKVE